MDLLGKTDQSHQLTVPESNDKGPRLKKREVLSPGLDRGLPQGMLFRPDKLPGEFDRDHTCRLQ